MEENKDEYLKKKLHIKDRFIKRLETEKRQLEIDNNSLKHRLWLVECRLDSFTKNRKKTICEGLQNVNHEHAPTQESQRISPSKFCARVMHSPDITVRGAEVDPHGMAGSMLPRYIPFPNSCTSNAEVAPDLHERIPMPAVNVGQDVKKDQLLNENLEYTLEISYLKARLKSSDAARTVAERKIESLEEKLRHLEKVSGRGMAAGNVEIAGQDCSRLFNELTNSLHSQARTSCSAPMNNHSSDVGTAPSRSARRDSTVVCSTLMTCLNRILQAVISLDEKMNRIQKDWQRHSLEKSS